MMLERAYGKGVIAAGCSLLMYFSMVISESLVARTCGTYAMRIFGQGSESWLVPAQVLVAGGIVVGACTTLDWGEYQSRGEFDTVQMGYPE